MSQTNVGQHRRAEARDVIGKGYVYEMFAFPPFDQYLEDLTAIPNGFQTDFIPPDHLLVRSLVDYPLPARGDQMTMYQFQSAEPDSDPAALLQQPLPPKRLVQLARSGLDQAVLDGAQSFQYPYPSGSFYPLWVISAWVALGQKLDAQTEWAASVQWVSGLLLGPNDPELQVECHRARKNLAKLPSDQVKLGPLFLQDSSRKLAQLLSNSMVSTHLVDIMISKLVERLDQSDRAGEIVVVGLIFQAELRKSWNGTKWVPTKYMEKLQGDLEHCQLLICILYLEERRHYISLNINFPDVSLAYGQSAGGLQSSCS